MNPLARLGRSSSSAPIGSGDTGPLRLLRSLCLGAGLLLALVGVVPASAIAQRSEHPFEIVPGSFHITPSSDQAGAHADLTTTFDFAHNEAGQTDNDARTTIVDLPPGFLGNNNAVPTCSDAQLAAEPAVECPLDSQVGRITLDLAPVGPTNPPLRDSFPVYNMEAKPGIAAVLGFHAFFIVQDLAVTVRPGDSGLTITSPNISDTAEPRAISVTIWGVPASPLHDAQRGQTCSSFGGLAFSEPECGGGGNAAGIPVRPFLSNPTSCGTAMQATVSSNSWQEPERFSEQSAEVAPMSGCERPPFGPSIEVVPTTNTVESASGLNVSLSVPQTYEFPESLATANLKDATLTLPEGFSLNPSAGSGLGVCSQAQLAQESFDSGPAEGCPLESKVGSVEVETPVLSEKATGSVFVAKPFENPFDSLLALYVVAKIPNRGVIVKVAGKVTPDPLTGRLVTTFADNPQVPFDSFTLKFRQGATSPLVSPPTCGSYSALADLASWAEPTEPRHLTSTFAIEHGLGGGACPSGGTPPFHPGLSAGTVNNAAGSYSPFYLRLSRRDGEQEITHFSIKLPPGVLADLSGVAKCSDAAIAQAKSREHEQGGAEEEARPSCPASSEVGHTLVEAGVGSVLAQAPGHIYLAGPYHGAPISLVSITSAKVGPFDLGTVVVRFALRVDPETTDVSVDGQGSDPIPHIIDGIPVHLRNIRTYVDRPHFSLNPTSCEPTSTASTVVGSGKDFVSASDDQPVTVTSPFQAADCASLGFRPRLKLELKGGKTHRGGLPAFKATLTARPGDANIGRAQVTLPPSEFLEQGHLKDVCPRSVWTQGTVPGERCPAKSIYGHAKATTPLLSEPLEGPVYLRTGYGTKLPQLVAALNAQEINVDVVGEIDSVHQKGSEVALLRNTFKTVPDAPVTRFELELKGGKKGLLVNSQNVCKGTHKALAAFTGQNGRLSETEPALTASGCKGGKGKGKKKGAHGKSTGGNGRR